MDNQEPIKPTIPADSVAAAEGVIGLSFTDAERELMLEGVAENHKRYEAIRSITLANDVPPAFSFDPRLPGMTFNMERHPIIVSTPDIPALPADLEDVAFWPVTHLAHLLRTQQVTSTALTEMYLRRLKRYDPVLHCVVTLTEDLALSQAKRADEEIERGEYRGPLHGIPWGAKDLLATRGIPTTWGATPYKDQVIDLNATVIERLEEAGAVLLAKLSVGALAWGDVWFDGMTRTPWNLEEGSSGSSAGSGAAVAAGLVGFAIGTETLGSIVSPSTQCRITGLRPTFGRVSRHGAMALAWTMDKIGPMCRTVEDCAIVFDAIYGPDNKDKTVTYYPFNWDPHVKLTDLRIGYMKAAFEGEGKSQENQALDTLRKLGAELIPIQLPDYPIEAVTIILSAEAAASFDDLTRSNRDDLLERQGKDAWPNSFRHSRLIPAVEYIQAHRIRTLLMQAMADIMDGIDVYVTPWLCEEDLILTNLTGHPTVCVPNGVDEKGKPSSVTFTGKLYGEAAALAAAKAFQDATEYHTLRPDLSGE